MAWTTWPQEVEEVGHVVSTGRKQRLGRLLLAAFVLWKLVQQPAHGLGLPSFQVSLPASVNLIKIISSLTLNTVKLPINIIGATHSWASEAPPGLRTQDTFLAAWNKPTLRPVLFPLTGMISVTWVVHLSTSACATGLELKSPIAPSWFNIASKSVSSNQIQQSPKTKAALRIHTTTIQPRCQNPQIFQVPYEVLRSLSIRPVLYM